MKLFLCLMAACAINCAPLSYREEIARVSSPDNIVDAVLIRSTGGATTSFAYFVYICPKGQRPPKNPARYYEDFLADHVDSLELVWKPERILEIRFTKARITHFSNYWQSIKVNNGTYVVELKLVPLDEKHSLSNKDRWLDEKGNKLTVGLPMFDTL